MAQGVAYVPEGGLSVGMLENLVRLTSFEAAGRLSGTAGAKHAAAYLAGQLAAAGYGPALAGGYLQPVDVAAARLVGPVRLKVGDREFRHRQDFGEIPALSATGKVSGPLVVLRDDEAADPDRLKGSVVLVAERPEGFDPAATAAAAASVGVGARLDDGRRPVKSGPSEFLASSKQKAADLSAAF